MNKTFLFALLGCSALSAPAWAACAPINAANIQLDAGPCAPASSTALSAEAVAARYGEAAAMAAANSAQAAAAAIAAAAFPVASVPPSIGTLLGNSAAGTLSTVPLSSRLLMQGGTLDVQPAGMTSAGVVSLQGVQAQVPGAPVAPAFPPIAGLFGADPVGNTPSSRAARRFTLTDFDNAPGQKAVGDGYTDNSCALAALEYSINLDASSASLNSYIADPPTGAYRIGTACQMPMFTRAVRVQGDGPNASRFIIDPETRLTGHSLFNWDHIIYGVGGNSTYDDVWSGASELGISGFPNAPNVQTGLTWYGISTKIDLHNLMLSNLSGGCVRWGVPYDNPSASVWESRMSSVDCYQSGSQTPAGAITIPGGTTVVTTTLAAATTAGTLTLATSTPGLASSVVAGETIQTGGVVIGTVGSVDGNGTITLQAALGVAEPINTPLTIWSPTVAYTGAGLFDTSSVTLSAASHEGTVTSTGTYNVTLPIGLQTPLTVAAPAGSSTLVLQTPALTTNVVHGETVAFGGVQIGLVNTGLSGTITLQAPLSTALGVGTPLTIGTPIDPQTLPIAGGVTSPGTGGCIPGIDPITTIAPTTNTVIVSDPAGVSCPAGAVLTVGTSYPRVGQYLQPQTGNGYDVPWNDAIMAVTAGGTLTLSQPTTVPPGGTVQVLENHPAYEVNSHTSLSNNIFWQNVFETYPGSGALITNESATPGVAGHFDWFGGMIHGQPLQALSLAAPVTQAPTPVDQGCVPGSVRGSPGYEACWQIPVSSIAAYSPRENITGAGIPTSPPTEVTFLMPPTGGNSYGYVRLSQPSTADMPAGSTPVTNLITQNLATPTANDLITINGPGTLHPWDHVALIGLSGNQTPPNGCFIHVGDPHSGDSAGVEIMHYGISSSFGNGICIDSGSATVEGQTVGTTGAAFIIGANVQGVTLDIPPQFRGSTAVAPAAIHSTFFKKLADASGIDVDGGLSTVTVGGVTQVQASGVQVSSVTVINGGSGNVVGQLYFDSGGDLFRASSVDTTGTITGTVGAVMGTLDILNALPQPSSPGVSLTVTGFDSHDGPTLPAGRPTAPRVAFTTTPVKSLALGGTVLAPSIAPTAVNGQSPVATAADLATLTLPPITSGNSVAAAGTGPLSATVLPTGGGTFYITTSSASNSWIKLPGNALAGVPVTYNLINATAASGSPWIFNVATGPGGSYTIQGGTPLDGPTGVIVYPGQNLPARGTPAAGVNTFASP